MIRNYVKMAWRNLVKNKISSIINISGLAIGLACVILIGMYVSDEFSYDQFFSDADRIYRVNLDGKMGNEEFTVGHTPPPVGAALMNNFPQIESYTRLYLPGDEIIHYEINGQKRSVTEKSLLAVDSNFLKFFDYQLIEGDAAICLNGINSVVLTQKASKKYFGDASPIGKTLDFDEYSKPFIVTGVLKDIPEQSSLQFELLQNTASVPPVQRFSWSWVWLQMSTYVKLNKEAASDPATITKIEHELPQLVATQAVGAFKRIGQPFDEFKRKGGKWDLHLEPLNDLHLYSADIGTRYFEQGDIKYIYIFSAVALFIILLACVNFMNLSTAQSARRAKEVGIRKVLGSLRKQLVRQFITEAVLYSLFAGIIAVFIAALILPAFNQISTKSLSIGMLGGFKPVLALVLLVVFTGLLAGSYPAFFLTSFKPVSVLKGSGLFKGSGRGFFTRNVLVVFQFTVSTVMIICTVVVYKQLVYNQSKDLGFDKENVLVIANADRLGTNEDVLRNELLRLPGVANASISTSLPTKKSFGDTYVPELNADDKHSAEDNIMLSSFIVDDAFVPTLNLKVLKGRAFSRDFADSASVILNETAAKQIGWKNPLGKNLTYPGHNNQKFKVIGIIKDFNTESLRSDIEPFALFYTTSKTYQTGTSYIAVRLKAGDYAAAIGNVERKWRELAPGLPFDYSFMDAEFDALYRSDQVMGKVFTIFTALSVAVACLGLLGLAIYTAERRMKEISIRKILGATMSNVVTMLSADFLKLIAIASVLAFPIAWYAMNKWLQGFAFRTDISWWVFAASAAVTLTVALLTISYQSIRAALISPAKSLRNE
ncbi:MAG TPA: ABC transporter permease [Mucilaginibacter sp.]|nr:ABC transporter permease [Mucilaginibacter sp.]